MAPQAYENALDGEPAETPIDVSYPHGHLAPDGAGGYWTESGGSWLHVDASGETARRFNLMGELGFSRVRGIAAATSTELIVSAGCLSRWAPRPVA